MATDVARLSYDPARHYTGVSNQQGRVTLEAEENEERLILTEERRAEMLDIVGPAGTPDGGYALSSPGDYDLEIGAGTMYVGGVRVSLDEPILYSDQPDWLDHEGDPDYHDPEREAGRGRARRAGTDRDGRHRDRGPRSARGRSRRARTPPPVRASFSGSTASRPTPQDCPTALKQDAKHWAQGRSRLRPGDDAARVDRTAARHLG